MPLPPILSACSQVSQALQMQPKLPLHRRLSAVSNGGSSWASIRQGSSVTSSEALSPLKEGLAAPKTSVDRAKINSELRMQLAALKKGSLNGNDPKVLALLQNLMRESQIFELFEDAEAMRHLAQRRLQDMSKDELPSVFEQCRQILVANQKKAEPVKVELISTLPMLGGVVTAARALLGPEAFEAALADAKASLFPDQQLERRYITVLLSVAAALHPSGTPCPTATLRSQCKPALEALAVGRNRLYPAKMKQLLRSIGRCLTDKRSDKLTACPPQLCPEPKIDGNDTPSDKQFVLLDSGDVVTPADIQEAPEIQAARQSWTRWWLTKMWAS